MRSLIFILAGLFALIAGFSSPTLHAPAVDRSCAAARAPTSTMGFFDAGLDNDQVREDKDAQPARKCASCFG